MPPYLICVPKSAKSVDLYQDRNKKLFYESWTKHTTCRGYTNKHTHTVFPFDLGGVENLKTVHRFGLSRFVFSGHRNELPYFLRKVPITQNNDNFISMYDTFSLVLSFEEAKVEKNKPTFFGRVFSNRIITFTGV